MSAQQANSLGNAAMKAGDYSAAAEHFAEAVTHAPNALLLRLNHAIALNALNRFREALETLAPVENDGRADAAYCSTCGMAWRGAGNLTEAAKWYDRALAIEPSRPRALEGRATVALERGEDNAVARFDRVLAQNSGDPWQWHGKAQALEVAGDMKRARAIAEQLVQQGPAWTLGLKYLAQLRLGEGEREWAGHYETAARRVPQDPNIPYEWASQLAGLERYEDALEVVTRARKAFPTIEHFALLEATYAGALGQHDIAETRLAELTTDSESRWVQEARHAIRLGQTDRADKALERVYAHNPFNITAWALQGLLWRVTQDARAQWLHGQNGLVRMMDLHDATRVLPPAIAVLHDLHGSSPMPLGQSLRGGTQTRGNLFDRTEPELMALRDAVSATLEAYRANLPPADEAHPLLRHRDAPWAITGSWSVRLAGGGDHHASHIHPSGIISSALYCELPEDVADNKAHSGWIELGRPPIDMPLDLPPLHTLQPKAGALALFPSTLYHGTRPFADGQRMTVAFDVTLGDGSRQ